MSGRSACDALDGFSAVADREHLDVLVGERELDDPLNRDAVVGEQQLCGHVRPAPRARPDVVVDEGR